MALIDPASTAAGLHSLRTVRQALTQPRFARLLLLEKAACLLSRI
jgi:hypothetical protein